MIDSITPRRALIVTGLVALLLFLGSALTETFLVRVECVSQKLFSGTRSQKCSRVLQELVTVKNRTGENVAAQHLSPAHQVRRLENQAWEDMLDAARTSPSFDYTEAENARSSSPPIAAPSLLDYGSAGGLDLGPIRGGLGNPGFGSDADE